MPLLRLPVPARASAARRAVVAAALGAALPAFAWSNHALCTWPALAALPEVATAASVRVETLEDFLVAEAPSLVRLLEDEEAWARAHVPTYPARPDALAFRVTGRESPLELRQRFLAALRINPESRLSLFVQLRPDAQPGARATRPPSEVTALQHSETVRANTYLALERGDTVPVIDVLAAASDEPDHGLDVGLFEDNGTAWGRTYGLGSQPFGYNPRIEFSSQGPLHVGFFHERAIVYRAAPFLQRTWPEWRIHLWKALAVHAFRSGHPYWGWRFAGWGLHYVQDLTQPYHARVLPGESLVSMLWISALDRMGWHRAKLDAQALVTNRHLALENFQLHRLRRAWRSGGPDDAMLRALADTRDDREVVFDDAAPRAVVSARSSARADAIDAALEAALPARYTADPRYDFGVTETGLDLDAVVARGAPEPRAAMEALLVSLLAEMGRESRAYVRAVIGASRTP